MSKYLEQIQQLVDLQKIDDAIFAESAKLENAPKELDILRTRFAAADRERQRLQDKVNLLAEQEKHLDSGIMEDTSRLKKSHTKLEQVTNQREYQAMAREIDTMEKNNRTRRDERKTLIEEKQTQQAALAEADADCTKIGSELQEKETGQEQQRAEAEKNLAALMAKRAETGGSIPASVLARYEFIRKRLPHPVIVPVEDGVCRGCRITIPPQTVIELQSGHGILNCPNCQRLIYWGKLFQEGSAEAEELH